MAATKTLAEEFGVVQPPRLDYEDPILLVEDQQDLRMILSHQLNKLGFRIVRQCKDGHEALHAIRAHTGKPFSVIICDRDMPLMGGYDVLSELKDSASFQRSAFAISLEAPDRGDIMLASENGVDGILVKPFSLKDILPRVVQAHKVFHNPSNPELVYELAKKEMKAKNLDKAEHIFQRLVQSTQRAARPLVGLARIAIEKQDNETALKLLEEAQQRNQYYVPIYTERGRILTRKEEIAGAIIEFRKAIDISPLNPIRYEEAAELMFRIHKYKECVELLSIALDHELSFPRLHHIMSQACFAEKDYKRAIKHIKQALSGEPENVNYLNQLGICYKESDQYEDATKTYNAVIKIDPTNRSALYNKSILLAAKNQFEEAIKLIKKCIEKHPDFEQGRKKLFEYEETLNKKAAG